jgi:hypothetical protein
MEFVTIVNFLDIMQGIVQLRELVNITLALILLDLLREEEEGAGPLEILQEAHLFLLEEEEGEEEDIDLEKHV